MSLITIAFATPDFTHRVVAELSDRAEAAFMIATQQAAEQARTPLACYLDDCYRAPVLLRTPDAATQRSAMTSVVVWTFQQADYP
jgi:hypothetical protein